MMLIFLNHRRGTRNSHSVSNNNYDFRNFCGLIMYLLNDFFFLFLFKVWEKLQADLKTNTNGEATWQGCFLLTPSEEKLTSKLANCAIK